MDATRKVSDYIEPGRYKGKLEDCRYLSESGVMLFSFQIEGKEHRCDTRHKLNGKTAKNYHLTEFLKSLGIEIGLKDRTLEGAEIETVIDMVKDRIVGLTYEVEVEEWICRPRHGSPCRASKVVQILGKVKSSEIKPQTNKETVAQVADIEPIVQSQEQEPEPDIDSTSSAFDKMIAEL